MKAAITDGKGNLWLADVPTPAVGEYQCLCKTQACATCTGTDRKHIEDKLPWSQNYPGILGHESIGYVVEVGPKVRTLKEGDTVLRPAAVYPGEQLGEYYSMWGGFAEYGLVTDRKALLEDQPDAQPNNYTRFQLPIPEGLGLSPADATMLITLKETASYVASVGVKLHSSLLILGAGSVALSMCRFAKVFGAYPVIMIGRRAAPLEHARKIGADFTINTQEQNPVEAARAITDGEGVDFIIDATGDAEFLNSCLPALKPDGKAAAYATYKSSDTIANTIDPARLAQGATGEDSAHQYLLDAVRLGLVDLTNYYSHRLPFERIEEGFELLKNKTAFKIVFEMEDGR